MTIKKEDLELIVSGGGGGSSTAPGPGLALPQRGPGGAGGAPWGAPGWWSPARAGPVAVGCPLQRAVLFLQMTEMEISRAAAERSLREHMGNVVEALITLTN